MAAVPPKTRFSVRQLKVGALWALVLAAVAWLLYLAATGTKAIPRKVAPDVATVRLEHVLPPPPPPPPPPPQKFVEQPKIKTPEAKPIQTPQPDKPPAPAGPSNPGPPALAARGEGPADAFGLGGNPNGGDFIGGGGGGGGGSAFGWYAQLLEARVAELLRRERRLHGVRYHVLAALWLSADGSVQRAELVSATGKLDVDRAIQEALKGMARLPEPPPAGMPEPVQMDLASR